MSSVDLSVTLASGRIRLTSCVYNASGPRSGTATALHRIATSGAGAVLTKSATLLEQKGNPLPRTHHSVDGMASFNSEGLPNNGIDYYIASDTIDEVLHGTADKPYMVSLSGKTLDDNVTMLQRLVQSPALHRIAGIELNLACPNVIGKPIIAYDFEQMDTILTEIGQQYAVHPTKLPPLGVKLPPYLDFSHFAMAAAVLNKHKHYVSYVAAINTVGNALAIDGTDAEAPYIRSNHGFAGLSGPAIKYTALANVRKLRELLHPDMDVVGVGGISTGQDVFDMILCGATCCQVATVLWKEGPDCFERILQELTAIMTIKGYTSLKDFRGKLSPWTKEGAAKSRTTVSKTHKANVSLATAKATNTSTAADVQFYRFLSMILAVIVAVLAVDKFGNVQLLPSES